MTETNTNASADKNPTTSGGYDPQRHAPVPLGELNTLEHTARFFNVHPKTIMRWVAERKVAQTGVHKQVWFTDRSIRAMIDAHTALHNVQHQDGTFGMPAGPDPIRRRRPTTRGSGAGSSQVE